uniref:hypothetical protein n=1 Tax=Proteiniphilum sp. UBA5346 TaxID=1947277 RepID=UPI00257B6E30
IIMKKKIFKFVGAAALVTVLGLNLSLGMNKKSVESVDLLNLSQTAQAACEAWNDWSAHGKCLQLSQICVFAIEYEQCDPYKS